MPLRRPGQPVLAILSVALLCGACGGTGTATSASPVASSTPTLPTAAPTAAPPTAGPTVTVAPTARETSNPSASPSSKTSTEPPQASLAAEGGDPVKGQLGSFTWAGGGSDSPWLPGAPLHVGAGERLMVSTPPGPGVTEWTARRVPAGSTDGSGAVALGGGPAPVAFDAPTTGSWSVQVAIRFTGDLGSATYYWRLDVD